ncbi:MAG: TolC family protein [Bacteroidia bacterium]|jgi:outer membrane protein|nr:TolC family protein [Bacteroidia bacterium]
MRQLFTWVLAATAIVTFAQNNAALSLSLNEALAQAQTNNQTLANAQLDIAYAETQVNEIKAQGLPQINGNAGFTHNLEIATQVLPDFISPSVYGVLFEEGLIAPKDLAVGTFPAQFGVPYSMQAGIGVNQLLFEGTFFLGLKAASEFVNISRLTASKSEIDIKEAVTKAYYMALISDQNRSQLSKSVENIQKLKDETQAMYDAGFAEKLDVDRLVLSVSNLEININQLENQVKLAKQLLLNSIGLDVNQQVELTSSLPEEVNALDDLAAAFDPENRIEIQLIDQQQELNKINLKRYKVGHVPSLFGNFNYGGNTFAGDGNFGDLGNKWYPISSYSVSLNVPIFDGFYKKAKSDQVKIDIQKTENTKKQAVLGMSLQVSQAKTNYINALKTIDLQKKSKVLAERIYSTTAIKFKEGIGSSFEMITAESDLTQARTNYLNALYELNVAKIDLNKALGIL